MNKKDKRILSAFKGGKIAIVRRLIREGADPNAKDQKGSTPIMYAAALGDLGIIESLIKAGADLQVRNKAGMTPLMFAIKKRKWDAAELISEHVAKEEALIRKAVGLFKKNPKNTQRDFLKNNLGVTVERTWSTIRELERRGIVSPAEGGKPREFIRDYEGNYVNVAEKAKYEAFLKRVIDVLIEQPDKASPNGIRLEFKLNDKKARKVLRDLEFRGCISAHKSGQWTRNVLRDYYGKDVTAIIKKKRKEEEEELCRKVMAFFIENPYKVSRNTLRSQLRLGILTSERIMNELEKRGCIGGAIDGYSHRRIYRDYDGNPVPDVVGKEIAKKNEDLCRKVMDFFIANPKTVSLSDLVHGLGLTYWEAKKAIVVLEERGCIEQNVRGRRSRKIFKDYDGNDVTDIIEKEERAKTEELCRKAIDFFIANPKMVSTVRIEEELNISLWVARRIMLELKKRGCIGPCLSGSKSRELLKDYEGNNISASIKKKLEDEEEAFLKRVMDFFIANPDSVTIVALAREFKISNNVANNTLRKLKERGYISSGINGRPRTIYRDYEGNDISASTKKKLEDEEEAFLKRVMDFFIANPDSVTVAAFVREFKISTGSANSTLRKLKERGCISGRMGVRPRMIYTDYEGNPLPGGDPDKELLWKALELFATPPERVSCNALINELKISTNKGNRLMAMLEKRGNISEIKKGKRSPRELLCDHMGNCNPIDYNNILDKKLLFGAFSFFAKYHMLTSANYLKSELNIDYKKAASIVDELEALGLISEFKGIPEEEPFDTVPKMIKPKEPKPRVVFRITPKDLEDAIKCTHYNDYAVLLMKCVGYLRNYAGTYKKGCTLSIAKEKFFKLREVTEEQVEEVVKDLVDLGYIRKPDGPDAPIELLRERWDWEESYGITGKEAARRLLWEEDLQRAINEFYIEVNRASYFALKKRLRVGEEKATKILKRLERLGYLGPYRGTKNPREVLKLNDLPMFSQ